MRSLVVVMLLVGACTQPDESDAVAEPTTTTQSAGFTSSAPSTAGESSATTTAPASGASSRPAPNPERPSAPEFSLILSDGALYEYANEVRPVYLVFWAEW